MVSSAGTWADSMAPTPKQYGSPEASTATGSPRWARIAGIELGDGARPGLELAARQAVGKGEMPLAADHQPGVADERARRWREPFGAVLADADDGEPSRLLTGRAHNATSSAA